MFFGPIRLFPTFKSKKSVLPGVGVTPDDFKRPFSRKRNKMSIAAKERNVLRIRFPSLVQSLGQRERLCALFFSTRHCPSQLGTINKVIWSPGKTLFLDLKVGKRHIGPKNNSKQLLFYWCYTHFCSFAQKSRFKGGGSGVKMTVFSETERNEYSTTGAKVA